MYAIRRPLWPKMEPDSFTYKSIWDCIKDAENDYREFNNLRIGDQQVMQFNLAGIDPASVSVKYDQDSNSIHVLVDNKLKHRMPLSSAPYSPPIIRATWHQGLLTVTIEDAKKVPKPLIDVPITEGTSDSRKFLQE